MKADGTFAEPGETGEILILGDTVSPGYFNNTKKTKQAFSTINVDGAKVRCYKTGDAGCLEKDGMLYYVGRIDMEKEVFKKIFDGKELAHFGFVCQFT